MERFIVAEVSKNWGDGQDLCEHGLDELLSRRFERVINVNRTRGYGLHSWKLSRTTYPSTNDPSKTILNETIIAVFEIVEFTES